MPVISLPSWGGRSEGPARSSEVEVVGLREVTDFYGRAAEFYRRLEGRRFNSIASFRDAGLREYFGSENARSSITTPTSLTICRLRSSSVPFRSTRMCRSSWSTHRAARV